MSGKKRNPATGKKEIEDVLLRQKPDRRMLSYVPDKQQIRNNVDRRGGKTLESFEGKADDYIRSIQSGIRYQVDYQVEVIVKGKHGRQKFTCRGLDISVTGILLKVANEKQQKILQDAVKIKLNFEIEPGTMPEGYEMRVKQQAVLARTITAQDGILCGMEFVKTLAEYATGRKDGYMLTVASLMLFFISSFIMLMRAESVIYFQFNKWLYLYSIIAATFLLSRYLFGALYRPVPIDKDYTPGVTIIIPCFNEEEWIHRTILSCVNQDYPVDKLEVIVVDDCSNDRSVEKIKETIEQLKREDAHYEIAKRVSYIVQPQNKGKRDALCEGAKKAQHELVVFVDSDSFLDPFAVRNLVQPFKDPKMGGVAGRTDVANTYTNALTKMQSVRYYIAFRIMKAAEAYFDGVACLSGPLSCYRKEIILDNMDAWLNQKFLGQKATFGDDRAMTNFVLRHHRTSYQDTAVCSTIVPNRHKVFLKQQMRWKRSWLRESIMAGKFMWRKEPFMAVFFYIGLIVPVAAPVVVIYNLIYVPITQRIFPTTFLVGLLLMSLIMSVVQLLLRRSSTWIYGMLFCIYYEAVLLWQMPVAWVTFWKSTWGTRMTPEDIKAQERKRNKKLKRDGKPAGNAAVADSAAAGEQPAAGPVSPAGSAAMAAAAGPAAAEGLAAAAAVRQPSGRIPDSAEEWGADVPAESVAEWIAGVSEESVAEWRAAAMAAVTGKRSAADDTGRHKARSRSAVKKASAAKLSRLNRKEARAVRKLAAIRRRKAAVEKRQAVRNRRKDSLEYL